MFRTALRTVQPSLSARAMSTSTPRAVYARMQLLGRLTADPEVRASRNGKDYIRYSLATNDPIGPPAEEGGERPEPTTSFHSIFVFGENAVQSIQRREIKKGTLVVVDADFRMTREPSEDGPPRDRILVQQRSLQVVSKPKPQAESE